jgi:hypothetical protein
MCALRPLFGLLVERTFLAEFAIFIEFYAVRIILFVFISLVITLLALGTGQCYCHAHKAHLA